MIIASLKRGYVMRIIVICLALLLPSLCLADEVMCYNKGKMVYHHHVHNIAFFEDSIIFIENGSGFYVTTNLDCMLKIV